MKIASKAQAGRDPIDPKRFPNIQAERDWDRAEHIRRAMEGGLSRKEAEKHADAELRDREE